MKRRTFIRLLGGTALSPILRSQAARTQPAMPVIGFVGARAPGQDPHLLSAFRQGLKDVGYVEGQNVSIDYRFAENQNDRLPALAADLVRRQVAVIATSGNAAALAAKRETSTIPIVFQTGANPVEMGFVASLNRPGGNLTGVTTMAVEVGPKRLELLHELAPAATVVALLVNPTNPNAESITRDLRAAATKLGLRLHVLHASSERDFGTAFASLVQLRAGALVIGPDGFFFSRGEHLAAASVRHAMPTVFQFREFAAAGGLLSYGASITDGWRLVGVYTGRILKGERPADLPVQQSTKVELIINLKTAKALGLTVPLSLLGRADEVIE